MKKFSQPALRADVSRVGEVFAPGSLTCIIFDPMVHPYFWSKIRREFSSSGIYKWLRLCDFGDMKNWFICDIFLKNQPEAEQEAIAIQTVIRCNGKRLYFSDLPNKAFYRLIGIYSNMVFKGHTGAIICDTGPNESGLLILFHQKLSQIIYPMVHGEP
jgi:hypothetical protein